MTLNQKIVKIINDLGSGRANEVCPSKNRQILFINLKSLMHRITGEDYREISKRYS